MNTAQIEINEITGYWTFLKSIDWQDPWLIGLISFHLVTTTTVMLTRHRANFQIFLFLLLLFAVYCSETINEYAATHWNVFSKQQYFDSHGLFISTVFSMPILLNCMLLIGAWLYSSTQLMATVKAAQLRAKARRADQPCNAKNVKRNAAAAATSQTEAGTTKSLKAD